MTDWPNDVSVVPYSGFPSSRKAVNLDRQVLMQFRPLVPEDAGAFQVLRLQGLREAPTAFASSFEEECDRPLAMVASRLSANGEGAVFGAFNKSDLVGVTGVRREDHSKLAHKAFLWGVYVAPTFRKRGIGRQLVSQALDFAFSTLGVRQVNLGVNTSNLGAIALYELMGFKTFGIEEGFLLVDGVLHDEMHMVCLRKEAASASGLGGDGASACPSDEGSCT
jgi:RimJ/RimL family protein N-acetyltransferase